MQDSTRKRESWLASTARPWPDTLKADLIAAADRLYGRVEIETFLRGFGLVVKAAWLHARARIVPASYEVDRRELLVGVSEFLQLEPGYRSREVKWRSAILGPFLSGSPGRAVQHVLEATREWREELRRKGPPVKRERPRAERLRVIPIKWRWGGSGRTRAGYRRLEAELGPS